MRGFKDLNGVDVDKIFKGRLKVYKGRSKEKKGFIRDVELKAYIGSWDYYVPMPVVKSLEKDVHIKEIIINLTNIAKSDDSKFDERLEGVVRGAQFYEAWKVFLDELRKGWDENKLFNCGSLYEAVCKNKKCGRRYIVKNPCKKEACPECGKKGSLYHMMLFAKATMYAKVMWKQSGAVGYFVITSPKELREKWKDKEVLSEVASDISRMFKEQGFKFGYYKWHFASEDNPGVWYPHLNVLIPAGYLKPEKLERIKRLIHKRFGVKVVHYEYAKDIARILHITYYVTRPTWNYQDEVSYKEFGRFKKSNIWGRKYFREKENWKDLLEDIKTTKRKKYNKMPEALFVNFAEVENEIERLDVIEEEEEKEVVSDELYLGPVSDKPERVEVSSPEEKELLDVSFEIWAIKEMLRNGFCSKCGEEVRWEGRVDDLTNEYVKGKIYRIAWNMWVIDSIEYPEENLSFPESILVVKNH
jgi:hypothetical protein